MAVIRIDPATGLADSRGRSGASGSGSGAKHMIRKWTISLFLLAVLGLAGFAAGQVSTNVEDQVFTTKATELTSSLTGRVDKIIALHAFVRDEIAQAKTQYG